VERADILIGARRHLESLKAGPADRITLDGDLGAALDRAGEEVNRGRSVCVVVSGDPGFFGLARLASARLGSDLVSVHPAPSSISLAFAAFAERWDDCVVASAHGRDPSHACEAVLRHPKVAVLTSPDTPPEALGQRLLELAAPPRRVRVASCLGEASESLWEGEVEGLADGSFDPLSVAIFEAPRAADHGAVASWGRPDDEYEHRGGMITKAEVRAVALGKLGVPETGVLWDVGSGCGSVAAECSRLAPGLAVYAVERDGEQLAMMRHNLAGTAASIVEGAAPEVLVALPDPDRAFVGGGGLEVLDAVLSRIRPGGVVVATYAAMERAVTAAGRLGALVQVSVSRGVEVGAGGALRLEAENPVFVCWGSRR
jgi:precorrin-6Y C5,15-methyltransferase (decarboxylating)